MMQEKIKVFETERLWVRQVMEKDFTFLYKLYTNQENMRYISSGRFDWNMDEIKEKYQKANINYRHGFGIFVVERKEDETLIGEAGLFDSFHNRKVLELGYIIDNTYWGNGYGTEICKGLIIYGFTDPELETIVARMYEENSASVRICRKSGMLCSETGQTIDNRTFYRYEIRRTKT